MPIIDSSRPALAALFILLLTAGCDSRRFELALSGPTMGTTYTVKVAALPDGMDGSALRIAIEEVLSEVDRLASGYRSDSQISRFNAADSTQWFEVSADLAGIVGAALELSDASDGAFDVTVAPLVDAWGFGPRGEPSSLPDAKRLAQLRAQVGYGKLHVRADPPALRKDTPHLTVDLNAIAPGFAVDRLAERLSSLGIQSFMIEIGGEVRAHGRNARGEPWRIAVERPVEVEQAPYAVIQLEDAAVSTSGEYRQYYVRDGRRYSHTIDPRTLRPVEHELGSVVVVAPDCMHADGWATALNVMGPEQGYELASQRGLAAMFITLRDGQWQARSTPGFGRYVAQGK